MEPKDRPPLTAEAFLGETRYELAEEAGGIFRVTRHNAEGSVEFRFPAALFDAYAKRVVSDGMSEFLWMLLQGRPRPR